jgi:hypothetical protein
VSLDVFLFARQGTPPSVVHTKETVQDVTNEVLDHPAYLYTPGVARSHCYLFGSLKGALGDRQFEDDDEVDKAVHDWIRTQPNTYPS